MKTLFYSIYFLYDVLCSVAEIKTYFIALN